jgi:hypothetical protein
LRLDQCFAGELCNVAIAAARALVLLPIGQMPEALIIPSIMLRRGQNGMTHRTIGCGSERKGEQLADRVFNLRIWGESPSRPKRVPVSPLISSSSDGTRSCVQTVMGGRITAAAVDFTALLQEIGCVHFASSGLFLVRN